MLHTLKEQLEALVAPALAQRLTLVVNHVLSSEAAAQQRLVPHTGRTVRLVLEGWPALLPPPPPLAWRVTPAGLLEWAASAEPAPAPAGPDPVADLTVRLDASNPALLLVRTLGGVVPPVQVEGDAQLAGDVNWLMQNLRWDVAADLERLFGPVMAQQLHQIGSALAQGVRAAVKGASGLRERWRSRP